MTHAAPVEAEAQGASSSVAGVIESTIRWPAS